MLMFYKRIGKGLGSYSLFPENVDIESIISSNGSDNDYYQSIFKYNESHYTKFIGALEQACIYLNVPFKKENALNITGKVLRTLKEKAKVGDKQAEDLRKNLSVSGTNDIHTSKLVFDFDSESNLELAKTETLSLHKKLLAKGLSDENIQICFSGNKGFSLEVVTKQMYNQEEFIDMVFSLADEYTTFDRKIKDVQRLFRLPLTKHQKTGLYKTPLLAGELAKMTKEDIVTQSKELSDSHWQIFDKWKKIDKLPESITSLKLPKVEKPKVERQIEDLFLDLSKKPHWLSESRFILQEGYFKKGNRNEAMMILASTYKLNGFDRHQAAALLDVVADKQSAINDESRKSSEEIDREVLDVVYSSMWKGGAYSEETNSLLQEIVQTYGLAKTNTKDDGGYTLDDMHSRFIDFAKNIDKNTIKTGIKELDDELLITTGMMVSILGSPSSGKSTISLNFLRNMSKSGEKSMFFSLDMPDNLIYSRLIQMFSDKPKSLKDLLNDYKTGNTTELEKAFVKMKQEFGNVTFETKSGTSIEDIRNKLTVYKQRMGESPKLVVVDYLEKVHAQYSDPTQRTGYIASSLADIARDFNCCVVLLVQPQKSAGDPSEELLSMRKIKGASIIEQDSRIVLTLWRPGFNPQDNSKDKFMSIAVVKNNMGSVGQFDFKWNGPNGDIGKLSHQDRQALKALIEEKSKKKEDDFEF